MNILCILLRAIGFFLSGGAILATNLGLFGYNLDVKTFTVSKLPTCATKKDVHEAKNEGLL